MGDEMTTETRTGKTRRGDDYVLQFVTAVDPKTCIGCGRCYKVCPRDVFNLVPRADVLDTDDDDLDDYDDDDDDEVMVMTIADAMDCIGCQACARVCPKDCHTHEPLSAIEAAE